MARLNTYNEQGLLSLTDREKMFAKHIPNKGLIPLINKKENKLF